MADNRKYYYMRLKENFFETNEIVLLEAMQDGYMYSNILLKLYLRSLKDDGKLMFNDRIPYNPQMIATITRHQVGTVEKALRIFQDMGLIEVLENGAMYMLDIQNFIGKTSTEADRKRKFERALNNERRNVGEISEKCVPELEIEIEKEIDIELEKEIKKDIEIKKEKKENTHTLFERLKSDYNLSDYLLSKVNDWITYKIERKEPYKEQGLKSLLRQIENNSLTYGDTAVSDLIDLCMSNNYKGIIWDKLKNQKQQQGDRIANRVSDVDNW